MLGRLSLFGRAAGRQLFQRPVSASIAQQHRLYSGPALLTKPEIEERILGVLKAFDRVKQDKLSLDAKFGSDLGLDSLDVVEVMIAVEEEFSLEIPDEVADRVSTPAEAAEYIFKAQGH